MSERRVVLSLLTLLVMVSVTQAQKKTSLEDLSWLTGCWEGRQGDAILEEIWSKPGGGSMLGLLAAIEGTYKGKEEREEFQMRKVRSNPKDELSKRIFRVPCGRKYFCDFAKNKTHNKTHKELI